MATPPATTQYHCEACCSHLVTESINIKGYCSSLALAPCCCLSVSVAPIQAYKVYNVCFRLPLRVILILILAHFFLLPLLPIAIFSALLALSHVQAVFTLLAATHDLHCLSVYCCHFVHKQSHASV